MLLHKCDSPTWLDSHLLLMLNCLFLSLAHCSHSRCSFCFVFFGLWLWHELLKPCSLSICKTKVGFVQLPHRKVAYQRHQQHRVLNDVVVLCRHLIQLSTTMMIISVTGVITKEEGAFMADLGPGILTILTFNTHEPLLPFPHLLVLSKAK